MDVKITTQHRCVVLYLVIFIFMLFPVDVFSKQGNVQQQPSLSQEEKDVAYHIEQLEDDQIRGDFVVGPGKVDVILNPGESKVVNLVVTNRMGEEKVFTFEVEDIKAGTDSEQPVVLLGDSRGPYTLKDYIHIPEMEFTLGHNQRATIPVTISLPPDAEPGGRYGSVLVSVVSKEGDLDDENGSTPSSAIVSRIGTLFFVTIPGSTDLEGKVVSFDTINQKHIFTDSPINFGITFENTGSVHLNPYGELHITNMFGSEVGFIEIDPWFTLPQSLRTREISWNRKPLLGRYTASVKINRGYDNIIDEASIAFWVIPIKPLIFIFIGLFFFFLLIRFIASRFEIKRRQ